MIVVSLVGESFTFCGPSSHGVRVRGPAGLAAPELCRGCRGPSPAPVKLFPGEGGGVSAAQAQRLPRPKAVQLRRFVPGKSTWERWSVWPIADECPSPYTQEVSSPILELPCPD